MTTDEILELLREVAAGVISPRFRALAAGEIHEKTPGDYVTIADREAEQAIAERLRSAYPQALVVGEEASFVQPTLMAGLQSAPHAFLIDPVDGTRNFVNGSRDHAVMLAELRHGEVSRGWILQPEYDAAYVSERGAGVTLNGEPLRPVPRKGTPRIESSSRRDIGELASWHVGKTSFCCGVDYPRLITGQVDALIYRRPKPWDHAAGTLMMTELGGVPRLLDGSPYAPGEPHGVLLAAESEDSWRMIADAIEAPAR